MKRLTDTNETDAQISAGRWTSGESSDPQEARAGRLLRQAIERRPVDEGALEAIRARLVRSPVRGVRRAGVWQLAAIGSVIVGGAALGLTATHVLRQSVPPPARLSPASSPSVPPGSLRRRATDGFAAHQLSQVEPRVEPAPPLLPPSPASPFPEAPRGESTSTARKRIGTASQPVSLAHETALARDARVLAEALHKLRQDDDPAAALALLDAPGDDLRAGPLTNEARMARIEALLRLRRTDQALTLLDTMSLVPTGPGREQLAARGELRARANRCADATADFDLLLRPSRTATGDAVAERALYGRASCRVRENDREQARRDLVAYLARYPHGRFAAAATAALSAAQK